MLSRGGRDGMQIRAGPRPVLAGVRVFTLRHPSKGGTVGTFSDDGIRGDPSRLRVVGLKLALCEPVT